MATADVIEGLDHGRRLAEKEWRRKRTAVPTALGHERRCETRSVMNQEWRGWSVTVRTARNQWVSTGSSGDLLWTNMGKVWTTSWKFSPGSLESPAPSNLKSRLSTTSEHACPQASLLGTHRWIALSCGSVPSLHEHTFENAMSRCGKGAPTARSGGTGRRVLRDISRARR